MMDFTALASDLGVHHLPLFIGAGLLLMLPFGLVELWQDGLPQLSREGGLALVTGENLGQVASQTLESLGAVQAVTTLPVLRPLIGLDKQEIVNLAQAIGTYELSIQSSDDCCQFLVPRQVVTRPSVAELDDAEAGLDVEGMVARALAAARMETVEAGS